MSDKLDPDTLSSSLAVRPEDVRAVVESERARLQRGQLMIQVGDGIRVLFSPDGSVEVQGNVSPSEAARVFWKAIAQYNPLAHEVARLRAALEAVVKADCCGCSVYGKIAQDALDNKETEG